MQRLFTLFILVFLYGEGHTQQLYCEKIPGFTAYAIPEEKGIVVDQYLGVKDWSNPETSVEFNLYCPEVMEARLRLMVSNGDEEDVEISVRFSDEERQIIIPPTGGYEKFEAVDLGLFDVSYPGFYTIRIKPIEKKGEYFVGIMNAQICAPNAETVSFPNTCLRNASTVYLDYLTDPNKYIDTIGLQVMVPSKYDYPGSEIVAIGNEKIQFGLGNIDDGKYLFVQWDSKLKACDSAFLQSQFSQKTIMKCKKSFKRILVPYNWSSDKNIHCRIVNQKDEFSNNRYLYFQINDPKKKSWYDVAILQLNHEAMNKSYGGYIYDIDPTTGYLERKVFFKNIRICYNDKSVETLKKTKFGHDSKGNEDRVDYGAGIENNSFWLSTGGFSFPKAKFGDIYTLSK